MNLTNEKLKQLLKLSIKANLEAPSPWFIHPTFGLSYGDPNDDKDSYQPDSDEVDTFIAALDPSIVTLLINELISAREIIQFYKKFDIIYGHTGSIFYPNKFKEVIVAEEEHIINPAQNHIEKFMK